MAPYTRQVFEPGQFPPNVRVKWPDEILEEGFVPFPKKLLRSLHALFDGAVEVDELAAILSIIDYRRPHPFRAPTVDFLAFTAGIPTQRFNAILSKLKKKGWVKLDYEPLDETVEISTEGFNLEVLKAVQSRKELQSKETNT